MKDQTNQTKDQDQTKKERNTKEIMIDFSFKITMAERRK